MTTGRTADSESLLEKGIDDFGVGTLGFRDMGLRGLGICEFGVEA